MNLLKTKTFWGGLASVATGVGLLVTHTGATVEAVNLIFMGVLAMTGRAAISKIGG